MAITNEQFATNLADLINRHHTAELTAAQLTTQLVALMVNSPGLFLPGRLGARIEDLIGDETTRLSELRNWWAGPANGGPSGDGMYPFTNDLGVVSFQPSPAKIIAALNASIGSVEGKVNRGGDTMTGPLTARLLGVDGLVDTDRLLLLLSNGLRRFGIFIPGGTGDANIGFTRYDDGGNYLAAWLIANRATGHATFESGITVNGTESVTGAWTPYAPSLAAENGTPGSASVPYYTYRKVGKTGEARARVSAPTPGTASGAMILSMPFFTVGGVQIPVQCQDAATGVPMHAYATGNSIVIFRSGFATPWVSGAVIDIKAHSLELSS